MMLARRRSIPANHEDRSRPRHRPGLRSTVLGQLVALLALGSLAAADPAPDRSLVDDLRKGGYVLYIRHFPTDHSKDDTDPLNLENTAAQRQLTDAGRAQATAFGEALRKLAIPIGSVVCSQFQRTLESARLIGVGEPVASADVSAGQSAKNADEKQARIDALRRLLSTPPAAGKNTLIVSHNSNLKDAAGVEFADAGEGEVVVFQPSGDGAFRKVARVFPPSVWTEWSARSD
jgi:phosphohistidine phosphatase SixA